jgi:hypothetical protein
MVCPLTVSESPKRHGAIFELVGTPLFIAAPLSVRLHPQVASQKTLSPASSVGISPRQIMRFLCRLIANGIDLVAPEPRVRSSGYGDWAERVVAVSINPRGDGSRAGKLRAALAVGTQTFLVHRSSSQ